MTSLARIASIEIVPAFWYPGRRAGLLEPVWRVLSCLHGTSPALLPVFLAKGFELLR